MVRVWSGVSVLVVAAVLCMGGQAFGITWYQNPANGHLYGVSEATTWDAAEAEAVGLGGHLATIRSQAENDWLVATFQVPWYYIGFNDAAEEGNWVWSSGESVVYTNWKEFEPNNLYDDESYALIDLANGLGDWNDWKGESAGIIELIRDQEVPEPATLALMALGCAALGLVRRRGRQATH
ncbi:MAG: lectin-like protein [Planctomycetota bacterium]